MAQQAEVQASAHKALNSIWMWSSADRLDRYYTLSYLGIINGLLPHIGLVLTVDDGQRIRLWSRWR